MYTYTYAGKELQMQKLTDGNISTHYIQPSLSWSWNTKTVQSGIHNLEMPEVGLPSTLIWPLPKCILKYNFKLKLIISPSFPTWPCALYSNAQLWPAQVGVFCDPSFP